MVLAGEVFDVVVDIRRGSPRFGQWVGTHLSADNCRQLYIPAGFAHGFAVVSDAAIFLYKCTDYYNPQDEYGVLWNDPALNIPWPVQDAVLSPKDLTFPALSQIPESDLPVFE
jgi:dTDP-4-dehydrorhamnose 3,5-epimerase